jgi:thiamine pyrophosphate-dependent acetolactate synthase large subunit-like protein
VGLVVGCRLGTQVAGGRGLPLPARLIQIDVDAPVVGRVRSVTVGIHADAAAALAALLEELPSQPVDPASSVSDLLQRLKQASQQPAGHPSAAPVLAAVRRALPADGVLANDTTMVCYQAPALFPVEHPRTFLYPNYFGTLGFSLPAAIGAQLACPDRQVVSLSGDGGFLFTGEELATAVREQLPLVAVVLNDGMYGAIDGYLRENFGGRALDLRLRNPDFPALGRAYGARAASVDRPADLEREIRAAAGRDTPTLIEYRMP